jgi:plasmid stabilization system protein ParE
MFMALTRLRQFMSFALIALGIFVFAPSALAVNVVTRIIDAHPPSRAPDYKINRCSELFFPNPELQIVETSMVFNPYGDMHSSQNRFESTKRSPEVDQVVERAINDWVQDRDYTPEQAQMLLKRDRELDPHRTSYIYFEHDNRVAIVRIFDGSDHVLKGGTEWFSASHSTDTMPIEMTRPGFHLPDAFKWELGLVDVNREIKNGVETIFNGVSKQLDLHYNNHDFVHLNSTKALEKKNMMIYAQVRTNRVEIFKKYGFTPTLAVDSAGNIKPFEVAPNLILISMKAEEFLRRYYSPKQYADTKTSKLPMDEADAQENLKKVREHLLEVDSRRIKLTTMTDIENESMRVFKIYLQARSILGKSEQRKDLIIDFFESYLPLINSIPPQFRHQNWQNMRNLTIEVMGHGDPFDAFYYFSSAMDSMGIGQTKVSPELFQKFISTPPPRHIPLVIPSEPTLRMRYDW